MSESPSALRLTRAAGQTLVEQLAAHHAALIRQRLLPPGSRLPSVRDSAHRHGVSPHTVVAAYDHLLALGLIEARPQRGFFVRESRPEPPSVRAAPPSSQTPQVPMDAGTLIRGMIGQNRHRPGPGQGTLPADWLDAPLLQGALRRVLQDTRADPDRDVSLHYGDPAGDARLRQALAVRLTTCGIPAPPDRIVTTQGATQALDLISRLLLQPGDAVLVDDPGWSVEHARLARLGVHLLPVPRGPDGPDLDVMTTLIREHRPRLYVTVSVLHNPTGGMLNVGTAHRLLQLAEAHDFHIVEDDSYAHFAPPHATRLSALDGLRRTFCVGGFSKILAPGWRVGFVAVPDAWLDRLLDLKMLTGLTTPALLEQAVATCLESGQLHRHTERVLARLDAARTRCVAMTTRAGGRFIHPPQGLFGWLDTGVDSEALAQRLLDAGWLTAPGHLFHVRRQPSTCMRVNFASGLDARFWQDFAQAREDLGAAPGMSNAT